MQTHAPAKIHLPMILFSFVIMRSSIIRDSSSFAISGHSPADIVSANKSHHHHHADEQARKSDVNATQSALVSCMSDLSDTFHLKLTQN